MKVTTKVHTPAKKKIKDLSVGEGVLSTSRVIWFRPNSIDLFFVSESEIGRRSFADFQGGEDEYPMIQSGSTILLTF